MKKVLYSIAAVAITVVAYLSFANTDETSKDIYAHPEVGTFDVYVSVTGELRAKNSIEIYGPQNARSVGVWQMKISDIIPEGTVVKEGDYVAQLDKSSIAELIKDMQTTVQKAESQYTQVRLDTALNLSQARDNLVNLKYAMEEAELKQELSQFEAPSIKRQSEINYEKAERAYEQAKTNYLTKEQQERARMSEVAAELTSQRQRMQMLVSVQQDFTVRAPADGMLIYDKEWNGRKKVVGSTIQAWSPVVATLPDLSVMESVTYVNEIDIQKLSLGQEVDIRLDADPDKRLQGTVTAVANIGEQRSNYDSKVFEVTINVEGSDTTLRPAMTTSNEILVASKDDVLSIPLECIHAKDSISFVYVKGRSEPVRKQIEVGLINDNSAEILRGVSKDDVLYLSVPTLPEEAPSIVRLDKTVAVKANADETE